MLGIIMAGGKGTRLFPLTENKPKPLVEILGIPVIDYVKDALMKASVEEIVVTTGFHGESLKKLVSSWDNNSDIECSVNQEAQPMGYCRERQITTRKANSDIHCCLRRCGIII